MSQESSVQEQPDEGTYDYDVVVVGSGFGGSVTALRLTEKGYRVGVLEAGRRFTRDTLPKNSWDIKNYLWAPRLGMYGKRPDQKRAVVTLAAGDTIEIFEAKGP